jgi:outer membrane protein insertion porin family
MTRGALRMNVGMRVRGGLLAALMMCVAPVAGTLVSTPAVAQSTASIEVAGNRRVEIETIQSYFKAGPGGRLDQAEIDDGLKALIETGLFQDVKISQTGGHLLVTVIENPVIGRAAYDRNPVQAAGDAVAPHGPVRRPAYLRGLPPLRPL